MASNPTFDARRGIWRMKYRPDPLGPWVSVTLCKHPAGWSPAKPPKKPPREAIERAKEFEEIEYRARHGLGAAPARARGVADHLEAYVTSHALTAKPASNIHLRRQVDRFKLFAESAGISSLQAVTRAHCRAYLEERIATVARSTLVVERGYLAGAWTRAMEDGLISANPWQGLETPGRKVDTSITFWSGEEIRRLAAACGKPWQSDLVLVLANTGMRISTALRMEWGWLDWQTGSIRIPVGVEDVKTAYTLALGRVARDVLQRRLATGDGSDLVFPNPLRPSKGIGYATASAAINRAIAGSKVKHGTCHDLRHSCARNMILSGIPITIVQRQLGHTTLAMTTKYVTADAESSAKFIDEFGIGE